jgi:hypothetical protein
MPVSKGEVCLSRDTLSKCSGTAKLEEVVRTRARLGSVRRDSRQPRKQNVFNSNPGSPRARTRNIDDRKRNSVSSIRLDRVAVEPSVFPARVVWDSLQPPEPQKVTCLEILSSSGFSSGIILKYIDGGRHKRLGYFHSEHKKQSSPLGGGSTADQNWLHRKRPRKFCIT